MKTYHINDVDLVHAIGSPSEEYLLSNIPRPWTLRRNYKMRRWELTCPEKPKDSPAYGIFWKEPAPRGQKTGGVESRTNRGVEPKK